MTAAKLLKEARAAGLDLVLGQDGSVKLRGDRDLRAEWAPKLRPHKEALRELLAPSAIGAKERELAEMAGQFYAHHWSCPSCRAGTHTGGKLHRPCPEGARLWGLYTKAASTKPNQHN